MEPFFETPRLVVRPFAPADLDDFAALMADPLVCRFMGDGKTLPRSEVERWIGICQQKYTVRGYGTSAVVEKSSGRFVGYSGVVKAPESDFDELIYAFGQPSWGRGYATEVSRAMVSHVFGLTPLAQIWATIDPENSATKRVLLKVGFDFDRTELEDGQPTEFHVLQRDSALPKEPL